MELWRQCPSSSPRRLRIRTSKLHSCSRSGRKSTKTSSNERRCADLGTFTSTTSEQWREWATKYRICLTAADPEHAKIFDVAEDWAADVNDRELAIDRVNNFTGVDDPAYLANQLYGSLVFHTTGEAQKVVTNVDSNSADAWRNLITRRWDPAVAKSGLSLMTQSACASSSDEAQRTASKVRELGLA